MINSSWVDIDYQVFTFTQWRKYEQEPRNACSADHPTVKLRANSSQISYDQNGFTCHWKLKQR